MPVCPKPADIGSLVCFDTCERDEDCQGNEKCCDGNCEKEMLHPGSGKVEYHKTCVKPAKLDYIDNCQDNPCENGGKCVDLINDYQCRCPRGYAGKTCTEETKACPKPEDLFSPCGEDMCENDDECTEGRICCNGSCPNPDKTKGYYKACVYPDPCIRKCSAHGKCIRTSLMDYACQCEAGYGPPDSCLSDMNDCVDKPCKNGGKCMDRLNGYQCCCPQGFTGQNCTEVNLCPLQTNLCEANKCKAHPKAKCFVKVHYVIDTDDGPTDVTDECLKP